MTCARLETKRFPSTLTPAARSAPTSLRKASGSSTTPLPMTLRHPARSTPQGTSWRINFLPLMITVWPALCPPAYRATSEKFSDSTSTILPLPSSPHWAPTITAVLPFFNSRLRVQEIAHTHCTNRVCTLLNRGQACESYWDKSGEDVYEVSYRVGVTNGNGRKRLPWPTRIGSSRDLCGGSQTTQGCQKLPQRALRLAKGDRETPVVLG